MSCATELLHPANFCPVCGARLAAPVPDGSAATLPSGINPSVVHLASEPGDEANVVYLHDDDDSHATHAVPANPHANDYTRPSPVVESSNHVPLHAIPEHDQADELRRRAAELQEALDAFSAQRKVPVPGSIEQHALVTDNPFGDFFSDGPTAWLVDEDDEEVVPLDKPRIVGTMLASGAILMLLFGWVWWARGMWVGKGGGAEAGGFLLISLLFWARYLSLPRSKQHAALLRWHDRLQRTVERRTEPLRERTEGQMYRRRERDRYRAMADERERRVSALGEQAYRHFRQGMLAGDLQPGAQRVLAIERQMITQDQHIHSLEQERLASSSGDLLNTRAQEDSQDGDEGHGSD